MMRRRPLRILVPLLAAAALASSCAYYNTFYLARRHYDRSLNGMPYPVDRTDLAQGAQFTKTIEYSRKVREQYPKSKWVDDAYLLEARALMGNDDPRQAVKLLDDFDTRYPNSPLKYEARFYLGAALRQSRRYERALTALDDFLANAPKHDLVPFAQLERARVLMSLERPAEAAEAATRALDRWGKNPLGVRARIARAEAQLAAKQYGPAREDYRVLGTRAANDEDRLVYLLRESECLEVGQRFDEALQLLRDAIAHEREPMVSDTTGGRPAAVITTVGYDRYGRLLVRIGSVQLRAGRAEDALAAYRRVAELYPRSGLAAEAQYRIGFAYETVLDDFPHAREEYARVQGMSAGSSFAEQAGRRMASLERLEKFRGASGGDSLQHKAEAQFMLAEQYLFQLDKPERALEEYRRIEEEFAGTPNQAKAILAQGWVLSRKLARAGEADSLFWAVVHEHPGTESQLAARDYLEMEGVSVPADLIRLPEPPVARADTMPPLPAPPEETPALGGLPGLTSQDSLRLGPRPLAPRTPGNVAGPAPYRGPGVAPPAGPDEQGAAPSPTGPAPVIREGANVARSRPAPRDSAAAVAPAPRDTVVVPALMPAPPDSTSQQ